MYPFVTRGTEDVEMNPESLTLVRVFQCVKAAFCRYSSKLAFLKIS